jgi:hypothetical protein
VVAPTTYWADVPRDVFGCHVYLIFSRYLEAPS